MSGYLLRRMFLLPVTLFAIILVNFIILNLAPGDPTTVANVGATGEAQRRMDESTVGENQYLLFREHYGLTLPILWNRWPWIKHAEVVDGLQQLAFAKTSLSVRAYHKLRTLWGDRARFIMPFLIQEAARSENAAEVRIIAANLFVRGAIQQGYVGVSLNAKQREENRVISQNNIALGHLRILEQDSMAQIEDKIAQLAAWYQMKTDEGEFALNSWDKLKTFFLKTRFSRYIGRVLTLDFGTLRNDSNKTVISEVAKRIKYSLTLAVIPLLAAFILCQIFGMVMAIYQNTWVDYSLNVFFLLLFAIPIFVVAPFLIEKIALNKTIPFTSIAIPYSGFHSPLEIYDTYTSSQRLWDISLHLLLPLIAIKYGTLAVQTRLSRTAFLEVLRQDYIRTARAKGLNALKIWVKHVGRNGAITLITSLAASLGAVLGGSLIVETIFEINGFGRFFYQAILNRDFNVVLFSAFAGSCLSLLGYIVADIAYTLLDPRVSLND